MYDRPFRWWVQSVMPLVFDDSLSYYEVLAKLTKYIEGLTGDVEQIEKILGTIEGIEDITQFTEFLERIQAEIGNLDNLQTDTKASLVSAINEVALKADIAYWKPPTGIPESDLSQEVKDKLNKTGEATKYIINNVELKAAPNNNSPTDLGLGTYSVPSGGIPWDTLSQDVKDRINAGGGTGGTSDYTELINKPQINGHTLNAGNNTSESLGLGTYSKPDGGIPESDLSAEVQEKLNTSGGIADSQQTFVASRDYEAGELVYINGVLYRTKYKILAGTNMVPGNNIEVTDISSELEKINSDINALQSGAGPDSWNLTATVESSGSNNRVDFFEYFNCIGGENYNFIVDPVNPGSNPIYYLIIKKRNGTVVLTEYVSNIDDANNRYRFTFTPTDTGEYYCTFYRGSTSGSDPAACKVTIEYTQSQGISELWAQVNAAAELEPRVSAVETLVGQQQGELEELDGIPERVENLENDTSELNNAVNNTPIDFTLNLGYVKTDGTLNTTTSSYRYSDLIPVNAGEQYHIETYASSNVLAVAFYEDGETTANTEVSIAVTGADVQEFNDTIIVPDDITGMRITCYLDNVSALDNCYKFGDLTIVKGEVDELKDAVSSIGYNEQINFTLNRGYVKTDGTLNTATSSYRFTDLIPVTPGEQYYIETYCSPSTLAVAFYAEGEETADTDLSIVGAGGAQQLTITIPADISAFRVTCYLANIDLLDNCYKLPKLSIIQNDIDKVYSKVKYCTNYELVKRKASVSFIFDDGNPKDANIRDIFNSKNKRCGFAIYTPNARYINYHDEGFEILAHAPGHIYDSATEEGVREILSTAFETINNLVGECYGWVTPASAMPTAYQPTVYDYFQYGYTISKGAESNPEDACMQPQIKSYQMWRTSLEGVSIAGIKAILDYAVTNNLLVCVYGHATYLNTEGYWTSADLEELLDYCDTIGIEVEIPYISTLKYLAHRHNED